MIKNNANFVLFQNAGMDTSWKMAHVSRESNFVSLYYQTSKI